LFSWATDPPANWKKGSNLLLRWSTGMIFPAATGVMVGACAMGQETVVGLTEATGESRPQPSKEVVGSRVDAFVAPNMTMRDFPGLS